MKLQPTRIAETILYTDDLDRAVDFYTRLFECRVVRRTPRFAALRIAPEEVLLLFVRGASVQPHHVDVGMIPAHDGHGPLHVCFGIETADVSRWEQRLVEFDIELESRVVWPGGGVSLYFRDPDNDAIELATPGIWPD